jgi:tetratricopeptide (TPR) repeat protein
MFALAAVALCACASVSNYRIGSDGLRAGDFDAVIMFTTEALKTGKLPLPMQARAYRNRGDAYFGKERYNLAIADFSAALAIVPDVDDTLNRRGVAYTETGQFDKALDDFTRAIKVSAHEHADYFLNRGVAHRRKGEYDLAIADYNDALRRRSTDPRIFENRATAYRAKGLYGLAAADYAIAIQSNPKEPSHYEDLCSTLVLAARPQAALPECNVWLALKPDNAAALDWRGFALFKMGQYGLAIRDYDAALSMNPSLASSLYVRGLAKVRMGDQAGGTSDIRAAQNIDPTIAAGIQALGATP